MAGFFPPVSGTVLDAGCSNGLTTNAIASRYPKSRVIGMNLDLVEMQDPLDNVEFIEGDLYHLERYFEEGSLSRIYAMNNVVFSRVLKGGSLGLRIRDSFYYALCEGGLVLFSKILYYSLLRKEEGIFIQMGLQDYEEYFGIPLYCLNDYLGSAFAKRVKKK